MNRKAKRNKYKKLQKEMKIIDDANANLRINNEDLRRQLNERSYVRLQEQITELKFQLNKNPCVVTPDWHCSDCLKENTELKKQIEKMKCCRNCKHASFLDDTCDCKVKNCKRYSKWECWK